MTTADPTVPSTAPQPAPLDLAPIEVRAHGYYLMSHQIGTWESPNLARAAAQSADDVPALVAEVRRLRAELDAAPAAPRTYQLPAQPYGPLWDNIGRRWDRSVEGGWQHVMGKGERRSSLHLAWHDLLEFVVSLSTVPPAGTEGDQ